MLDFVCFYLLYFISISIIIIIIIIIMLILLSSSLHPSNFHYFLEGHIIYISDHKKNSNTKKTNRNRQQINKQTKHMEMKRKCKDNKIRLKINSRDQVTCKSPWLEKGVHKSEICDRR